ncbi:MAG TPA: hypothetical protein VK811_01440 [Candidatus Acidoferrum sp.]|nr:hypothetical protein [Candidatus Acidoferrum sp.]
MEKSLRTATSGKGFFLVRVLVLETPVLFITANVGFGWHMPWKSNRQSNLRRFRRKPLILSTFINFYQVLTSKKDSMSTRHTKLRSGSNTVVTRWQRGAQRCSETEKFADRKMANDALRSQKMAGFIGFRRKPLILSAFVSFCR